MSKGREFNKVFGNCRPLTYVAVILGVFTVYFWVKVKSLDTALQNPNRRCFIRGAAACLPRLSPGQSSHLSVLWGSTASVGFVMSKCRCFFREEKIGIFRTWFLRPSLSIYCRMRQIPQGCLHLSTYKRYLTSSSAVKSFYRWILLLQPTQYSETDIILTLVSLKFYFLESSPHYFTTSLLSL